MLWKYGSWEQAPLRFVLVYFRCFIFFFYFRCFILFYIWWGFYCIFPVTFHFNLCLCHFLDSNILTSVKRCWSWVLFFTLGTADCIEWDFPLLSGMSQLQYVRWKIACCFICWILFSMNMGRIVVANVNSMSKSTFSTNNSLPWKIHKIYLINPCAFF